MCSGILHGGSRRNIGYISLRRDPFAPQSDIVHCQQNANAVSDRRERLFCGVTVYNC